MPIQVDQSPSWTTRVPSVATLAYCAAGIAAVMAWVPATPDGDRAATSGVSDAPTRTTCAGCGVVESVREIDGRDERAAESTRSYEVTIRLQDGSRRVFNEATPRSWRSGTRVMIID